MLRSEVYLSAVDGRDKKCRRDHERKSMPLSMDEIRAVGKIMNTCRGDL
jgi:hypothetical protein